MGNPRGFLESKRIKEGEAPVDERLAHAREFVVEPAPEVVREQAGRCMDCGIPFCHSACPLGNLIPEWNDLLHHGQGDRAVARLLDTNNFPEVTGRVCPAPCEASCVLNIEETPVAIKLVERSLANLATERGELYAPRPSLPSTGRSVAVIGSGPAGMAAAQQLARLGHAVTLFEKDDRLGGLLRYGIPDFKLEKHLLDRRFEQMEKEGVRLRPGVGVDHRNAAEIARSHDAVVVAVGARIPRDADLPGRAFGGVHFAMDFLTQHNRRVAGDRLDEATVISAAGKRVIVLGGGDTGSDCVGTSLRQGAREVTQLELMPKPPLSRAPQNPWPEWPLVLRTSSSHREGEELRHEEQDKPRLGRDWAVSTVRFHGEGREGREGEDRGSGQVTSLEAVRVKLEGGRPVPLGEESFHLPCDLVFLAMGFTGPEHDGPVGAYGLAKDARGNVVTDAAGRTSVEKIFATGDASRGQSLVVWAIADGRRVAAGVDRSLAAGAVAQAG